MNTWPGTQSPDVVLSMCNGLGNLECGSGSTGARQRDGGCDFGKALSVNMLIGSQNACKRHGHLQYSSF